MINLPCHRRTWIKWNTTPRAINHLMRVNATVRARDLLMGTEWEPVRIAYIGEKLVVVLDRLGHEKVFNKATMGVKEL